MLNPPGLDALPVDRVIPDLRIALRNGTAAVLQAPAGAGKTTHVPLALVDEGWLAGRKILVLEPRRLAARAVAHRMARLRREDIGDTVGYRVHRDTRVGARTRIEVVTEGILTRMIQNDPTLDGVGLVIFDEFHERSVHADLGLALALYSRTIVRPDLRILVMSATLDQTRVASMIDGVVIASEGRQYPVDVEYSPRPDSRSLAAAVVTTTMRALNAETGDVLVFLPGGREIRRVHTLLADRIPDDVRIDVLYGDLSPQAQDAAIGAAPAGTRKIVLATPIAETSITIEGVTVVVDSGLARAPRFSPRSGMTRLGTVRISRASAAQRAGRAGRLRPGKCFRMWPAHEQFHLLDHTPAEILQADLTSLVLELAVAGIDDSATLQWLDQPPAAAIQHATQLLQMLGAIDGDGRPTQHGREMALLPVHPRIAHMLLVAREHGAGKLAADIAAILGERDFVHGVNGPPDADIELRLQMLHSGSRGSTGSGSGEVDFATMHRAAAEAAALKQQLDLRNARVPVRQTMPTAGALLGLAYPDRIAKARTRDADGSFLLRNGRGAVLSHPQALSSAEFIVAAELDGDTRAARIFLGASLTRAELEEYYQDQFEVRRIVEWNDHSSAVEARTETRLGAIVLNESRDAKPDVDVALALLIDAIRREGTAALPWTRTATQLRDRMAFMHGRADGWPDVSDTALMESLNEWLAPNLRGHTSLHGIESEIENAISNMLDWRQRSELDRLAPTHYVAPTGSRIPIDYGNPDAPAVAVRLQEMFGVATTPTIDDGKVALILQLLSPARRPVQVTRDIAGFWRGSYFDVRKELRGRYPKHVWPDDPLAQSPTTRTKPRR